MILLTSTSDILRVVTGAAVSAITAHVSWADNASGTITPGRTNTSIATATTTTVCAAPGGSTQRNIKLVVISNTDTAAACPVTLQHYDGSTSVDLSNFTLLAGERLAVTYDGAVRHYAADGAEYAFNGPPVTNLGTAGTIAETFPREIVTETNSAFGTSGTLYMQAIYLRAGQLVSSITIWSATTAASGPTNCLFGLFDSSRNQLATSANQTTTAWTANTARTLAMATPYRVPTSGLYYIGYLMTVSTTMPTLKGNVARAATTLANVAPILQGASSTGLTTALPNPAGAITVGTASFYAAVS